MSHLKRHLEMERLFGADSIPRRRASAPPAPAAAAARSSTVDPGFDAFRAQVLSCKKCGLSKTRTQVVFGVGPLDAKLMFIGEAPGEDEDRQGEPFVGRAGQLLNRILKDVGVPRERVYIANIVKCRPPGNRAPDLGEVQQCIPHLFRQIQRISPKLVVALGGVAAQTLLNTTKGISSLRGRIVDSPLGFRLLATYHPAYILRGAASRKPDLVRDIKAACRDVGLI